MKTKFLLLTLFFLFSFHSAFALPIPDDIDITVAADGSGDYTTIQDAIDAVPTNSSTYTLIYIKNGTYEEPLDIASNQVKVILYGEDELGVIITYATEEVEDLATLTVNAKEFIAYNLSIVNTAGSTYGPAQALRQETDKLIFVNCRIIGNQDTFRNRVGRSYFKNCYFEGTVDFIFGDGTCIFEDCDLYSKGGTAITAASTKEYVDFGYIFRNCRVSAASGVSTYLGRPWREYAAVAFINCELPDNIKSEGWYNWGDEAKEETSRYAEYMNYGPGADPDSRVDWANMMVKTEADNYETLEVLKNTASSSSVVDNWNPYKVLANTGIVNLSVDGDGYGINEGGNGGTEVEVTTETDLRTYATSDDKYVISVSGNIELTEDLNIGSNTTITGVNEESGISGYALNIKDETKNVIVKYLNISNSDGNGISISNSKNVFISHISFSDCADELCSISEGADSVTVSWCRFYYSDSDNDGYGLLANGSSSTDSEHQLNLTMHHNWWYKKLQQDLPAATNTNLHLYNNYWNCIDNTSGTAAKSNTELYLERNYYSYLTDPCFNESDGLIYTHDNEYDNCSGTASTATESISSPEYYYMLSPSTDDIPEIVTARAGNVWEEPDTYTLKTNSGGNGSVSPAGTNTYNFGTLVTIEAEPDDNYTFYIWMGDTTGDSSKVTLYMEEDFSVTAIFTEQEDEVEVIDSTSSLLQSTSNNIVIYPNPSENGTFYIPMNNYQTGNYLATIYNSQGKLIQQAFLYTNKNTIEIDTDLSSGFYYLNISGADLNTTQKIVVL